MVDIRISFKNKFSVFLILCTRNFNLVKSHIIFDELGIAVINCHKAK